MKKLLILTAVVVVLLMAATPAFANWSWCSTDPLVILPHGQGTVHIAVSVPKEYAEQTVTIGLAAPEGSKIVPHGGPIDLKVVPTGVSDGDTIVATVAAGFPVQVSAKYKGQALGVFTFEDGHGTAPWEW